MEQAIKQMHAVEGELASVAPSLCSRGTWTLQRRK